MASEFMPGRPPGEWLEEATLTNVQLGSGPTSLEDMLTDILDMVTDEEGCQIGEEERGRAAKIVRAVLHAVLTASELEAVFTNDTGQQYKVHAELRPVGQHDGHVSWYVFTPGADNLANDQQGES